MSAPAFSHEDRKLTYVQKLLNTNEFMINMVPFVVSQTVMKSIETDFQDLYHSTRHPYQVLKHSLMEQLFQYPAKEIPLGQTNINQLIVSGPTPADIKNIILAIQESEEKISFQGQDFVNKLQLHLNIMTQLSMDL